ncbi:hypothetical protein PRUPE_4G226100 [Prunus persica]|uniref:Uncharacterized protein n=1 Tax=Prunus persica TaxID=3760 RepID=A0A251PPK7_PRUPE|nr:hypothetical protein PRUPE_4G226100 [Prunus persica]
MASYSSSKTFLLLGFMFALVILISSEVSARELVEITKPATYIGFTPFTPGRGPVIKCGRRPYSECLPPRGAPQPPASGEYRHGQSHHEKQGPGVAETETGN